MYFYLQKGRQVLDLRGDLVLSHNSDLCIGRIKSAAPASVRNAKYIVGLPRMGVAAKLRASAAVLRFIWGGSQAIITPENEPTAGGA